MKKYRSIFFLATFLMLIFISFSFAKTEALNLEQVKEEVEKEWIPRLVGRVTDLAKVFPEARLMELTKKLTQYENETTHQIVILTIPSLRGEAIESFSLRVANAWGIGHHGLDNGILITVATGDRQIRIEVGFGLEKAVPDQLAARIISEDMIPAFRKGDYASGIEIAADSLMKAARQYVVPPDKMPK
ncbi:TPM domain-containing protein [Thermodesulfobacteriota bacterium]